MDTPRPAIAAEHLHKRYGKTTALDDFTLHTQPGTVHALLGPNGAGKTTAVRVLATLLRPDGGHAEVAGHDVTASPADVRARIGLVGQNTAVDEMLSGRRNLEMFGRLYHLNARTAAHRAHDLLDRFGLAEAADKPAKSYSGGMRRRLDLAAGLILAPAVLFLDEPTTGLDPRARAEVWQTVRALVADGTTVLLTTQYLDEADQLAGRVSVIDNGKVIAEDTPAGLKSLIGGDRIDIVVRDTADLAAAADLAGANTHINHDDRRISAPVTDRVRALTDLIRALDERGIAIDDIAVRRPTLDEVFLRLTGHGTDNQKEAA